MCTSQCTDRQDISVMDSVVIERPTGGVKGLITITKLITLADAGSIHTCYHFQWNKRKAIKQHHSQIMHLI